MGEGEERSKSYGRKGWKEKNGKGMIVAENIARELRNGSMAQGKKGI